MTINKTQEGETLTIALEGRLDTTTAPQLEGELRTSVDGITELVFDLTDLEYVSSAGLRVLLSAQKVMNRQGNMTVRNVSSEVMDVFELTGFSEILNIEQ
jgi:anti-sigma B factor antagonist